jgi:spermidine synthase
MKPWETLETATAPDGSPLRLDRRDDEYVLRMGGHVLMSSRQHESEEALAREACARLSSRAEARVLVGGLGFGYTVRAALDALGPGAKVVVAELLPQLVTWNEGLLAPLAGRPLKDPRTEVVVSDVAKVLAKSSGRFDAVLLDVDNGPFGLSQAGNKRLYGHSGLEVAVAAVKKGGVLGVWSAAAAPGFARRMRDAGLEVQVVPVRAHAGAGAKHVLFLGIR